MGEDQARCATRRRQRRARAHDDSAPWVAPGDLDADGIPDAIDINVNGDGIIDNVNRSATPLARTAAADWGTPPDWIKSMLGTTLSQTANANSPATAAAIPTAMQGFLTLGIGIEPGRQHHA